MNTLIKNIKRNRREIKKQKEEYEKLYLSKRQADVLKLMREHKDWTQQNIGDHLGISQGKVSALIKSMRRNNPQLTNEIIMFNKSLSVNYYEIRRDSEINSRIL